MISYLNFLKKGARLVHNSVSYISKTQQIHTQYLSNLDSENITNHQKRPAKRTKTVCTIGPATEAPQNAVQLIDQGLSVARFNFSHGDHAQHRNQMVGIIQAMKRRPNSHVATMLDTKGPQVRTGNNEQNKPIFVKKGQLLEITTDYTHLGNNKRIACSYQNLTKSTSVGKRILIADGAVIGTVKSIQKGIVTIELHSDGKIGNKKNMCLPGCPITLPTITQLDKIDIIQFGLKYKVDQIAVSFARRGKDLAELRQMLVGLDPVHGPNIHLISKIQNRQAIQNLQDIISQSDGIMVARGDLGMELPLQKVVIAQKYIIDRTLSAGKYSITATQMLDSMQTKPRPTRAQVSDITNAVLDLSDATMLSGQTTGGLFPFDAVRYMRKIAQQAESFCDYQTIFNRRKQAGKDYYAMGPIGLSFLTRCDLIFVSVESNYKIIQRLAAWRPRAYIIVFTDSLKVRSALAPTFGVFCYPALQGSPSKIQIFEQFLTNYGENYQTGTKLPSRALFLRLDEHKGHITQQQPLHI